MRNGLLETASRIRGLTIKIYEKFWSDENVLHHDYDDAYVSICFSEFIALYTKKS